MTTDLLTRPDTRLWTPQDPEILDDVTRREFLAGLAAAGLLAACGDDGDGNAPAAVTADGFPRTIRHAGGETTFAAPPARVVALDTAGMTDPLLALGVTPVGSTTYSVVGPDDTRFPAALDGMVEAIASVGSNAEPNLEAIAGLDPDLLFGYQFSFPNLDTARAIAPVLVAADDATWQQVLDLAAGALGREAQRDAVLVRIDEAVTALRAVGQGRRVQVVRPRGDGTTLVGVAADGPRAVLERAGVALQPLPPGEDWSPGVVSISDEFLTELASAEDLVVISYELDPDDRDDIYPGNPLWSRLPAVAAGRVHPVQGTAWTNYGALGLLRVLDEATAALTR